jgi:hypothetical protein
MRIRFKIHSFIHSFEGSIFQETHDKKILPLTSNTPLETMAQTKATTKTQLFDTMGSSQSKTELHQALSDQLQATQNDALVLLAKNDTTEAIDVMSDAFQNDPLFCWVGGIDCAKDPEATKASRLELAKFSLAWVNDDLFNGRRGYTIGVRNEQQQLVGCMSMAPGSCSSLSILDNIRMFWKYGMPPMYKASGKDKYCPTAGKRLDLLGQLDAARYRHMSVKGQTQKWIYVQTIGVRTAHQHGNGKYGSTMLRTLLRTGTAMNAAIYLETESKENESMYQHFGFETLEEVTLCVPRDDQNDSSFVMYLMRWKPPCGTVQQKLDH